MGTEVFRQSDVSGNIHATGWFNGTCDFDPGTDTFNLSTNGLGAIFVVNLDASGNFVWAKDMSGSGPAEGLSIATDSDGNSFAVGYFRNTVDFDPGVGTHTLGSLGAHDAFILKLDALGNFAWVRYVGGSANDVADEVVVDASGNVIVEGQFYYTADFGPLTAEGLTLPTAGASDAFLAKIDGSGNWDWVKLVGGSSIDQGRSLALDASGNIYTTGVFTITADFDPGPRVTNLTTVGGQDVFISKLDWWGNLVWAKKVGGSSVESVSSIAVDSFGNVFTTGNFQYTANFDPNGTFNLISAGAEDVFILKLAEVEPYVVEGNIFGDLNEDCYYDISDVEQFNIFVKAEPGPFYGISDKNGNYIIHIYDTGAYVIFPIIQDTLWQPACTSAYNLNVTILPDTSSGFNLPMQPALYCSRLAVELSA